MKPFCTKRFLRGEQDRFQNEFQFHDKRWLRLCDSVKAVNERAGNFGVRRHVAALPPGARLCPVERGQPQQLRKICLLEYA